MVSWRADFLLRLTKNYAKVAEQKTAHLSARMNATLDIQKSNKLRTLVRSETQGLFDVNERFSNLVVKIVEHSPRSLIEKNKHFPASD